MAEITLTTITADIEALTAQVNTLQQMLAALVTATTVEDTTTYEAKVTDTTVAAAVWGAESKVVDSVTNLDNLTVPTADAIAEAVWATEVKEVSSVEDVTNITIPTAAEVAQAVWNNDIVSTSLRTVTATEAQLPADTVVQADVSPDAIAGIAAAVWGYNATGDNARTLTSNVLAITNTDGETQTIALT